MKIVNSWKPLTLFAKSCIIDVWLTSEYISAVRITQNKTKLEDTKEHFISVGILNICKFYMFECHCSFIHSSSTKAAFSTFVWPFQRVSHVYPTNPVIKSFLKNPDEINLKRITLFKGHEENSWKIIRGELFHMEYDK